MNKQLPSHLYKEFFTKKNNTILLIPIWNEGQRIKTQLQRLKNANISHIADIVLLDGGSTDDSINKEFLNKMNVRTIFSTDAKGQSSAYRIGFAKALEDGYQYCITVDGNNKDSVEQIPEFLRTLQEGFDFVQGSRFMEGDITKILLKLGNLLSNIFLILCYPMFQDSIIPKLCQHFVVLTLTSLKTLVWIFSGIFSKPGSYNGIWHHVFHV